MNDDGKLHVVLGAGQIGTRLSEILLTRGHRVRQVRRGQAGPQRRGLEWASGDITDLRFAEEVGRGAAVVYDCMNPLYHQWPDLLLPIAEGGIRAASSSGSRLVALDCLYMYGKPNGPMTERTPMAPSSKKGELRVKLAERRLAAHRGGEAEVTIGRASDFFGANLPYSYFSERFFERIIKGRSAEAFGDPDLPHSYTYADDVARSLAILGDRKEAAGEVFLLPTPAAETTRTLMQKVGAALGLDVNVSRVPSWVVRAIGLVSPMMREMHEMIYQWEVPFVVDDTKFRTTFGVEATPLPQAIEETAAWARKRFGLAGSPRRAA